MDLLSLMNQRITDQHSEARRSRCVSVAYVGGALALSLLAAFVAPCANAGDRGVVSQSNSVLFLSATASAVLFVVSSLGVLLCMVRAAATLATDRFLPLPPGYSNGSGNRPASSYVVLPRNEQLSEKMRRVLVGGFYAAVAVALCLGLTQCPPAIYFFVVCVQWLLYLTYLFMLTKAASTARG